MRHYRISADNVVIIGCGGVASWLLPLLIKLVANHGDPHLLLIDGDKLEERNLDRQLFSRDDMGKNKAQALCEKYTPMYPRMAARPTYLAEGEEVPEQALWFGCADNHTARRHILQYIDRLGGRAIIGGNEYTDAEAYVYEQEWKDTPLDPRIYYPELLTDHANDPTRPQSCQGVAADTNPQLVLANYQAAAHMAWLFWFYYIQRVGMDRKETYDYWPVQHANNHSKFRTINVLEKMRTPPPRQRMTAINAPIATE